MYVSSTDDLDFSAIGETEYSTDHGTIIEGDALDVLESLPSDEFHAIVTDPPYAISFMDKEWDQFRRRRNENDEGRDDVGGRLSSKAPASGAEGDNYEYHRWCMMWAEKAKRVLKPGGHILAFSGNRTHHRLMSAMEDVGYEIRDTVTWHYGEGMPKGASLSTWLDGEEAERWGDWKATIKPSTEFVVMARAPLGERSATKNQVEHGTGNLNVVETKVAPDHGIDEDGRFPPNLALDGVMAEVMDLQSGVNEGDGERTTNAEIDGTSDDVDVHEGYTRPNASNFTDDDPDCVRSYGDSGGASRFFYCSKASKNERTHDGEVDNDHPTVKPTDLMEWLVKLVTAEGQKVLDPFLGSGTTMLAADNVDRQCVGIEQSEEYVELSRQRFDAN